MARIASYEEVPPPDGVLIDEKGAPLGEEARTAHFGLSLEELRDVEEELEAAGLGKREVFSCWVPERGHHEIVVFRLSEKAMRLAARIQGDETGLLLDSTGEPLTLARRCELLRVPVGMLVLMEGRLHAAGMTEHVEPSGLRILDHDGWWEGFDEWKAAGSPNVHGEPTEPVE